MLLTLTASIHHPLRAGAPGAAGLHSQRLQRPLQEAQYQACWTNCTLPTKVLCNPAGVPGAAWAATISYLHKAMESSPRPGSLMLPSYCACTGTISHAIQLFEITLFLERIQCVSLCLFSTKHKLCELF